MQSAGVEELECAVDPAKRDQSNPRQKVRANKNYPFLIFELTT
jgi:hypothetical protein